MGTLLLLRHAKSDWDAGAATDLDRPLSARGVRSARLVGRLLADRGLVPALVLTSPAVRARTTAELAAEAGGWVTQVLTEPRLYDGGVSSAVAVVESVGAGHDPVMLVGHEPTWSMLVHRLTGEDVRLTTANVAVVESGDGGPRLLEVINPREWFGSRYDTG